MMKDLLYVQWIILHRASMKKGPVDTKAAKQLSNCGGEI
jgi:hypothetical protein